MTDDPEPSRPKKKARKRRRGDDPETRAAGESPAEAEVPAASEAAVAGSQAVAFEDARVLALRWPLLGAAAAAVLGLALVGTGPSDAGMWVCVAGGVGLIASIHRLGRLGAA